MLVLPQTRRAEDSRARILSAARGLFTTLGFERTTIRAVAAEARIDPSMVMRYFGSKEGLFAAAADIDLGLPDMTGLGPQASAQRLAEAVSALFATQGPLELLLRAAASNASASARLRDVIATQIAPLMAGRPDAETRTALLAGHILGHGAARRLAGLDTLGTPEATALLARTLEPLFR